MIKCRFGEPHKVPKGCKWCVHYDRDMKACGKVTYWPRSKKIEATST